MLYLRRINGDLLSAWLRDHGDEDELLSMYEELGYRVGYLHKYGVYHNHLKTDNVVVNEGGMPIIIDWKWGESHRRVPEDERGSKFGDSRLLLPTARDILERKVSIKSIDKLEAVYRERRKRELSTSCEVSKEQLWERAYQFLMACYSSSADPGPF